MNLEVSRNFFYSFYIRLLCIIGSAAVMSALFGHWVGSALLFLRRLYFAGFAFFSALAVRSAPYAGLSMLKFVLK